MNYKKLLVSVASLLTAMTIGSFVQSASVEAAQQAISGSYVATDKEQILKRLNDIRKEAYNEGLVDRYVELKWSAELEQIAEIRAAEASVLLAHSRPNGHGDPYQIVVDNVRSHGENLALNNTGIMAGIDFFYSEKQAYIKYLNKQPLAAGEVYGHYYNLIRPDYTHTALAAYRQNGRSVITAQELTSTTWLGYAGFNTNLSETQIGRNGLTTVMIGRDGSETTVPTAANNSGQGKWEQDSITKKYFYRKANGSFARNEWVGSYYLKSNGEMADAEWVFDSSYNKWFYLKSGGSYARNEWIGDYYLKGNGIMADNEWVFDTAYNKWFYLKVGGSYVRNEWAGSYYLKGNGAMADDEWIFDNSYNKWFSLKKGGVYARNEWKDSYYLKGNGTMADGEWIFDEAYNNWFYLKTGGSYARNEWIGDYYLKANGEMARNELVDGMLVDASGKRLVISVETNE